MIGIGIGLGLSRWPKGTGGSVPNDAITDPREDHAGRYITDPRPGHEGEYVTEPEGYGP